MQEDWQEITIGVNNKSGLLAKLEKYKQSDAEEELSWTPISPIETVRIKKKPNYKGKLFLLTIVFICLQIGLFISAENKLFNFQKLELTIDYGAYLDIARSSITNELGAMLGETKKIYKTENLLSNQKEKMNELIFAPDSKYLYYGIFELADLKLKPEEEYYSENFSFYEESFQKLLVTEEGSLVRSANGNTYLHNLSFAGFQGIISLLSIPRENSKILLVAFDSSHWIELFTGINIGTFFIMNDSGSIILHSDKEVVLTGADYSELKFLDFILREKPHNLTRELQISKTKTLICHIRKIIPIDSYIVFLEEPKNIHSTGFQWEPIFYYSSAGLLALLYSILVIRVIFSRR